MLAHNVYFTLKDQTPAARAALLAGCRAHLTNHEGTVFFACGTLEPGLDRPVNVRDFDVALHLIFATRADHDRYQEHPRHLCFVAEHRETWANVRVFDSTVE
ncbi:MAG: Dabb family protein [Isosphaeraceae bacterium]